MRWYYAVAVAVLVALSGCATSGGLGTFGAETGVRETPAGAVRVPYTSVISYYGYAEPGAQPDAVINGRDHWFIYLWVPVVAPEVGVRMISPVPEGTEPQEGDFVAASYADGSATDPDTFFDTWIALERATAIVNPGDIRDAVATTPWLTLASNDDSSEMPPQPSGSQYNSLLRVTADAEPLVRGLYRIAFTTYRSGPVQGTFLAQVGAPIELPGTVVARDIETLLAAIEE